MKEIGKHQGKQLLAMVILFLTVWCLSSFDLENWPAGWQFAESRLLTERNLGTTLFNLLLMESMY